MPSGGGGTSKTVSTQELSPEQRKLIGMVMPAAEDYMNTPLKLFPGSTIAGPTQLQQQGRQDILKATGGVQNVANNSINTAQQLMAGRTGAQQGAQQGLQAGQGALGGLGQVLGEYQKTAGARDFLASGALLDPSTNPVLAAQTEAAIRPITQQLQESVLPGIRSQSIGNNMFGSSRQGIAEGRAIGDWQRQAGDIATQLQMNNFNQGLGAMLQTTQGAREGAGQAVGQGLAAGAQGANTLGNLAIQSLMQSPALAQLSLMPGMIKEGVGQMGQQEQQARLSEQANRYVTEQMLPFMQAQDVANLAFGLGGGSAVTEASRNTGGSALQTGLGIGQLALMMMGLPGLGMF